MATRENGKLHLSGSTRPNGPMVANSVEPITPAQAWGGIVTPYNVFS